MPTRKNRTPSKCRDWERDRRNRFNAAIFRLRALVIENEIQTGDAHDGSGSVPNLSKIEILQKAILVITELKDQKFKLNGEILSLKVKLEKLEATCHEVKSRSNSKSVNVDETKPSPPLKPNTRPLEQTKYKGHRKNVNLIATKQDKTLKRNNETNKNNAKTTPPAIFKKKHKFKQLRLQKSSLTNILLKSSLKFNRKKEVPMSCADKTLVLLPGTPIVMPPRPFILPAQPPTILLLPTGFPQVARNAFPILPRQTHCDVTKTTMVNKLPIPAYSYPLSVAKKHNKTSPIIDKNTTAPRVVDVIQRRFLKASRQKQMLPKNKIQKSEANKENCPSDKSSDTKAVEKEQSIIEDRKGGGEKEPQVGNEISKEPSEATKSKPKKDQLDQYLDNNDKTPDDNTLLKSNIDISDEQHQSIVMETSSLNLKEKKDKEEKNTSRASTETKVAEKENMVNSIHKPFEISNQEQIQKSVKSTNLLESTICENNVDGGNARLELAEEFLAASPTAAFLLAFPLVSGARPDTPSDDPVTSSSSHVAISTVSTSTVSVTTSQTSSTNLDSFFAKQSNMRSIQKDVKPTQKTSAQYPSHDKIKVLDDKHLFNDKYTMSSSSKKFTNSTSNSITDFMYPPFTMQPAPSTTSTSYSLSEPVYTMENDPFFHKNIIPPLSQSFINAMHPTKADTNLVLKNNSTNVFSNVGNGDLNNCTNYFPCAVEKYSSKGSKGDFTNMDDVNNMKLGSSRFSYDFDVMLPQKSYEYSNPVTTSSSLAKDFILSVPSSYTNTNSMAYNPFNTDLHLPYMTNSTTTSSNVNKKCSKTLPSFYSDITNLYSQTPTLWSEDITYHNNHIKSNTLPKGTTWPSLGTEQSSENKLLTGAKSDLKHNILPLQKHYGNTSYRPAVLDVDQLLPEKTNKKSPTKTHVNWMTSELRSLQNHNYDIYHSETKDAKQQCTPINEAQFGDNSQSHKKQDAVENNTLAVAMPSFSSQMIPEEFHQQSWPNTRGTNLADVFVEPPPLNLPTLVGDLALGPQPIGLVPERRRSSDKLPRSTAAQTDILHGNANFFSVSHLVDRTLDNISAPRSAVPLPIDNHKPSKTKSDNMFIYPNVSSERAQMIGLNDPNHQPCYYYNNEVKPATVAAPMENYQQNKSKITQKSTPKSNKTNYSAEVLMHGVPQNNQKYPELYPGLKLSNSNQKCFQDMNTTLPDAQFSQVSHFSSILDYAENSFTPQQFTGNALYSTNSNAMTPSFYSNYMPGSSNIMSTNYSGAAGYSTDFVDVPPSSECNFTYPRYDNYKVRNSINCLSDDKYTMEHSKISIPTRESTKHKLETSKKDLSKKSQSKRSKIDNENWNLMPENSFWPAKSAAKRNASILPDDIFSTTFPSNHTHPYNMSDIFNSHTVAPMLPIASTSNTRSSVSYTANSSRANFNLSTIFPEIAKKIQ